MILDKLKHLKISISLIILVIVCFNISQATTKVNCDQNCDFKITNIPTTDPNFQLSKDSSYLVAIDANNDAIQVVDIDNDPQKPSRTLSISSGQSMSCNQFLHECIIQNDSALIPLPKKLDLSMSYQDLSLQDVKLPQSYSQSPAKIGSLSSSHSVLIQKSTNQLVIFKNSDQSIVIQQVSPSSDLPLSDGISLLNFVLLNQCIYKFDANASRLDVVNLFCTIMGFTENHIIELDTLYKRFNFISKDTFKQLEFSRIDDLTGIAPDEKHGYVENQLESSYDIYTIDDIAAGKVIKLRSVTEDNDCKSMSGSTFSKTIKAKYGLLKSFNSKESLETVCFYQFTSHSNSKDNGSDSFPVWAIVLIVILALVIVAGVILGIYCYKKKKRERREKKLQGQYDSLAIGISPS